MKRKGLPARGEQLRTEEMNIVPLLVTFELGIILTLEMTKLRLTRLSDLPKVIQLLSDEAWLLGQCAPNTVMCLLPPTPHPPLPGLRPG